MTPTSNNNRGSRGQNRPENNSPGRKKEISLWQAIMLELKDGLRNLRYKVSIDQEDLIKWIITGLLILINVLLQTTFFVRFSPFGSTPDIVLIFCVAMGASEGEKYGAVCGLICSYLLRCLGGVGNLDLCPLLYTMSGYFAGIMSKNYFSNTVAVKAVYVLAACVLRAVVSTVTAAYLLSASFSQIITDIVLGEFLSTAVISPLIFFTVWLCFRKFHKSRAERTGI